MLSNHKSFEGYRGYFDGGLKQNRMNIGWVCYGPDNKLVDKHGETIHEKHNTVNIAEYLGLISLLEWAFKTGIKRIRISGDCQTVCHQINKIYTCKSKILKPYYLRCVELIAQFECCEITWVKRQYNTEADAMTHLGDSNG